MQQPGTWELLKFVTSGSVDDGKSTLIGRLLHDSNQIYQDQLDAVRAVSATASPHGIDFALVTDGLRAEREQGITIDVAFRYFATARRKFIIADVPGHEQYTRNMATGASIASLAVLVMDARKGFLPQTYRHAAIAWLLGIRSFIVAVNKMDLVGFQEGRFCDLVRQFTDFSSKLNSVTATFVPICAPDGDNVVRPSTRTPWYTGATLLEQLEGAPVGASTKLDGLRLPVQTVLRCHGRARRYAGKLASGVVHRGDTVLTLPSGRTARVASIHIGYQEVESASVPASVSLELDTELDISRGDMLVNPECPPVVSNRIGAMLLWVSGTPLEGGRRYLIKHTTRTVCATVTRVCSVIDPSTMERQNAATLAPNDFGEVEIETHQQMFFDAYSENRTTGGFILIDPLSNSTLAAGMISGAAEDSGAAQDATSSDRGLTVWFTGLSSAGKSTLGRAVYEKLWARGYKTEWIDGDVIRRNLCKDLGFSRAGRDENIRRIGFVAELLTRHGVIVLVSAISPYSAARAEVRRRIGRFIEVYVNSPLDTCERRDLKGIYSRAREGELHGVTGVDDPYEPPVAPEVECHTDRETLAESAAKVLEAIDRCLERDDGG